MSPQRLVRVTVLVAAMAGSGVAGADTTQHPQTHHCKMPDGTMDMKKTHRQCTAAKGTWAKDAAKDAPKDAAKDAPKDAAKPSAPAPKK